LTSCVEKRIYGGTCENKLLLRHSGKLFVSITDVIGITVNNGGEKYMNKNVQLTAPSIRVTNFTYHLPFL
jgi:hypothetical protein